MCAGKAKAAHDLVFGDLGKRWREERGIKAERKERLDAIGLSNGETCKGRGEMEGRKERSEKEDESEQEDKEEMKGRRHGQGEVCGQD